MQSVIAFVGFKGSGKNTAAEALYPHFKPISFADAIKDCLAAIFCWDRSMLEGITSTSRLWREQVDPWWAEKLDIPQFTPRWAMTNFGTEVMRRHFNESIWLLNVERRIDNASAPIVLPDARFPDEIAMVRRRGGQVYRIQRGSDPWWVENARHAACGNVAHRAVLTDVHESEWAWLAEDVDAVIHNNGTIADLHAKVINAVRLASPPPL